MLRRGLFLEGLSLAVMLGGSSGCPSSDAKPEPAELPAASPEPEPKPPEPPPPAPPGALDFGEDTSWQKWPQTKRQDDLPACVFGSWPEWKEAEFIEQVKPNASLRVGHAIHFGVYGPGCAAPECVRNAMLQCWVDMEGSLITLHARYNAFEKPAASCSTGCLSVTAQCNTPQLGKGEYTVVYGADRWKVRVPSVVRPACRPR